MYIEKKSVPDTVNHSLVLGNTDLKPCQSNDPEDGV